MSLNVLGCLAVPIGHEFEILRAPSKLSRGTIRNRFPYCVDQDYVVQIGNVNSMNLMLLLRVFLTLCSAMAGLLAAALASTVIAVVIIGMDGLDQSFSSSPMGVAAVAVVAAYCVGALIMGFVGWRYSGRWLTRLKASQVVETSDAFCERGGARYPFFGLEINATWPFARLAVAHHGMLLRVPGREFRLSKEQINAVKVHNGSFSRGIAIEGSNNERLVFWSFDVSRLCGKLKEFGYDVG